MTLHTTQRTQIITKGALRPVAVGAGLGAAPAGLFGAAFGEIAALIGWDLGTVATVAAYFALCGFIAGGLLGLLCAVVDGGGIYECDPDSADRPLMQPQTSGKRTASRWSELEGRGAGVAQVRQDELLPQANGVPRRTNGVPPNRGIARYESRLEQLRHPLGGQESRVSATLGPLV